MRGRAAALGLALLAASEPARALDPPSPPIDPPRATDPPEPAAPAAPAVTAVTAAPPRDDGEGESEGPPRYDLAAWETAAILGVGTTWYWLDRRTNQQDWDDPPLLARFDGDYWRLDNNRFGINFVGHPLTGALSYGLARAHRIGPGGAFGFALGTSLLWELGVEFREKVSVNDVVVTAPAAVPIGELAYKAGVEVAEAFGEAGPRASRDRSRRASLALEAGTLARSPLGASSFVRAVVDADLAWIAHYRNHGAYSGGFARAELVTGRVEVPLSVHGSGFDGEAIAVLAGYHAQAIEGDGEGRRGWSLTVGTPVAFRYVASSALGFRELLATTRLPGVDLRAAWYRPPLRLEADLDANLDFAGMSSPAHPRWAEANPDAVGKTILRRQGYFYGLGPSARARFACIVGDVALRMELDGLSVRSLDGLDRTQETLTFDERLAGQTARARASADVALGAGWSFGARAEARRWRSRVEDVRFEVRADFLGLAIMHDF